MRWMVGASSEESYGKSLLPFLVIVNIISLYTHAPPQIRLPPSLWHDPRHAPPEIASHPAFPFPCIRIHDLEIVAQPGVSEYGDII